MALIIGGFIGFILLIAIILYILKLFSITIFNIPGIDPFFHYFIICVPYIIFFSAYYYLLKKSIFSKSRPSKIISGILLITGSITCFATFMLASIKFFGVKNEWLNTFSENSHYALIFQLILLFATAGVIATGDPKEKDWREREEN